MFLTSNGADLSNVFLNINDVAQMRPGEVVLNK